jgi:hypothetical protein
LALKLATPLNRGNDRRRAKSEQADHRKRTMVIAENGDGDRWSDHSVTGRL